jgi:antitoxin VapB
MRLTENDPRISSLRELYQAGGYSSLVITQAPTLSWLLGGRVQIGIAGSTGICKAVVNAQGVVVLTNNIEAERLAREEVGTVPRMVAAPWQDAAAARRAEEAAAGPRPLQETDCAAAVQRLRAVLLPQQENEAREVAALCSRAVTDVIPRIRPGMTEYAISGALSDCAVSLGLIPNVLFTPVDGHIRRYRHALNSTEKLEKIVMLSLGAQYNGLYCSITRFLSFGTPDAQTLAAQEKACAVSAMLYTKTRPGVSYAELYHQLEICYADLGAAAELSLHHQGGMGGYQTRENRLIPTLAGEVHAHQLYAWNPSVTGFKSEDLLLVGDAENTVLTDTPAYPVRAFSCGGQTWRIPQILIR